MRVLIACEFSGIVRDAFKDRGHDAWSCDLLPTERPGQHLICDIRSLVGDFDICAQKWDLIIAHPPCTYLCNSGVRWLKPNGIFNNSRRLKMLASCDFFAALYWSKCKRIAIENPVMHGYAKSYLLFKHGIPSQTQTIQMWEYGEPESKRTCLHLRGLPPLKPSSDVHEEMMNRTTAERNRVHYACPGLDRWKERSRTLPGIASAMAEQWSL